MNNENNVTENTAVAVPEKKEVLVINSPPCSLCASCGFSAGAELFDPQLLPLLKYADELEKKGLGAIAWRIHLHAGRDANEPKHYYAEILLRLNPPFTGYVLFDGPMYPDAKKAIQEAVDGAGDFMAMTE